MGEIRSETAQVSTEQRDFRELGEKIFFVKKPKKSMHRIVYNSVNEPSRCRRPHFLFNLFWYSVPLAQNYLIHVNYLEYRPTNSHYYPNVEEKIVTEKVYNLQQHSIKQITK
jgi:hypothetical protein